ncbi:MAG: UbiA family prenyltransferase [Candidatus Micrarchaeota archaeon]|nr:UbiA family prenyltransferase [Candidatus Micrarchaeota archaeon]
MVYIATYIEMMRPGNCLMALVSAFIGFFLVSGAGYSMFSVNLLFALVAVFLITGAGNVINDYYDVESDRINRPSRPIPSGRISSKNAKGFAYTLFAAGILLSFINLFVFAIALINSLVLVLYSKVFQNKVLLGNLSVAYLAGSTFIYGAAAAGNAMMLANPFILGVLAALATLAREIVKDLEDIEGDKKSFLKRITKKVGEIASRFRLTKDGVKPKLGEKTAVSIVVLSLISAVVLSFLPLAIGIMGLGYLVFVVPCDAVFAFAIFDLVFRRHTRIYSRISYRIKIGMILGFVAFIIGMLF